MPVIFVLKRLKLKDLEVKASLDYIVSLRAACATWQDPVSNKNTGFYPSCVTLIYCKSSGKLWSLSKLRLVICKMGVQVAPA